MGLYRHGASVDEAEVQTLANNAAKLFFNPFLTSLFTV
jgi:hypothetical protein